MANYFVRFLNSEFEAIRAKNPRFSKRAFARKLNLDPAVLIAILGGRRKVTVNLAKKLLAKLPIENKVLEESLLLSLVDEKYELPETKLVPREVYEETDSWLDSAVLALAKPPTVSNSKTKVARNLRVSMEELAPVFARLERQGYIRQNKTVFTVNERLDEHVARARGSKNLDKLQVEYMMKAIEAFERDSTGPLQITGSVFSCSLEKLPAAMQMISSFRAKLANFLHDDQSDVAYRFNSQLFPISRMSTEDRARCLDEMKKAREARARK